MPYNPGNGSGVWVDQFAARSGVALPSATVRSLDPPELRDIVAVVAAPHDDRLGRFVADLRQRGLPTAHFRRVISNFYESDSFLERATLLPGHSRYASVLTAFY